MTVSAAEPVSSFLSIDRDYNRIYTSTYKVVSDTADESPRAVINASGIPAFRSQYRWPPSGPVVDAWAFCSGVDASLLDPLDRLHWLVTVLHESARRENARRPVNTERQNPIDEPIEYDGGTILLSDYRYTDRDSKRFRSSSEERFGPQTVQREIDTLTLSFNTATIDLQLRNQAVGSVNNAVFWGYAANKIKLARWPYQTNYYGESNTPYVAQQLEFHIDDVGLHRLRIQDEGTRSIADGGATDPKDRYSTTDFKDEDGNRFVRPLNGSGQPIAEPDPTIIFRNFDWREEFDFSTLPVPGTLPNPPFTPPT